MDDDHHMIQPKPMLADDVAAQQMQQIRTDGSPMVIPPMQEMNQMEIQFNTPAQQAAVLAEQQRAAAMQQEMVRQKEIQRLQQQSQKQPTGNTNIRKLIKSAATRD